MCQDGLVPMGGLPSLRRRRGDSMGGCEVGLGEEEGGETLVRMQNMREDSKILFKRIVHFKLFSPIIPIISVTILIFF